jgi:hypothetical protein
VNASPHHRVALHNIQLATICRYKFIDKYGAAMVVSGAPGEGFAGSSFGAAMRRLDRKTGVDLAVPNNGAAGGAFRVQKFRGWCVLLSADTPAAHMMCGFKAGVGPRTEKPCRGCDCSSSNIRQANSFIDPERNIFNLRDPVTHQAQKEHFGSLKTKTAKTRFGKSVGVTTFAHAFTGIPHFDVTADCPQDLMHVELEGNLKVECAALLYRLIAVHRWFTVEQLNQAMHTYPWPVADTHTRPTDFTNTIKEGQDGGIPKKDCHLKMHSAQVMQFVLHSPEVLRDLIKDKDLSLDEWRCWMLHHAYFAMMLKSSFTWDDVVQLDQLILAHQDLFLSIPAYRELFKPKNHYAQHIPHNIALFGPPRNYWCMAFEAEHQWFKRVGTGSNWKAVLRTMVSTWGAKTGFDLKAGTHDDWAAPRLLDTHETEHGVRPGQSEIADLFFDIKANNGFEVVGGDSVDLVNVRSFHFRQRTYTAHTSWVLISVGGCDSPQLALMVAVWAVGDCIVMAFELCDTAVTGPDGILTLSDHDLKAEGKQRWVVCLDGASMTPLLRVSSYDGGALSHRFLPR